MARHRVEFSPEALQEIDDAFEWYRERSTGAAEAFLSELGRGVAVIAGEPNSWPVFEAGTHRYVLRRYPFSLIFLILENRIFVVAVAHHARRPRYWRNRLPGGFRD